MTPFLILACLIAAPLQPVAGAFSVLTGWGRPIGEMSAATSTPVIPAGYAFSIWGVIFALSIAFAVWQALPNGRASALASRVRAPLTLAIVGNLAWMITAQLTPNGWHLVALIVVILAGSLWALFASRGASAASAFERWVVLPYVGLFAGWVTAATFANVSGAMRASGFDWSGVEGTLAAVVLLAIAGLLVARVLDRTGGSPWYAGAAGWALVAIVVANLERAEGQLLVAAAATLTLLAVLAVSFLAMRRPGGPLPSAR